MSLPKIDSEESDRKTKHKINFYLVIPFSQVGMSNQQRQPGVQTNSCFYG